MAVVGGAPTRNGGKGPRDRPGPPPAPIRRRRPGCVADGEGGAGSRGRRAPRVSTSLHQTPHHVPGGLRWALEDLDAAAAPHARRLKPAAGFPTSDGWRLPSRRNRAASQGRLRKAAHSPRAARARRRQLRTRGPRNSRCAPRTAAPRHTGSMADDRVRVYARIRPQGTSREEFGDAAVRCLGENSVSVDDLEGAVNDSLRNSVQGGVAAAAPMRVRPPSFRRLRPRLPQRWPSESSTSPSLSQSSDKSAAR